ncbi:MAG TPA: sugar ABC transporter permease, partial [Thermomicrobiales bacterium]|nr:sugar ABC transporter permease [Thermomicrobiales bacterium]
MAIAQQTAHNPAMPRAAAFRRRLRKAIPAYLFILPGMALFLVWTLYPLIYAFIMSFAEWNLIKPSRFVGLENYRRAFDDPIFWMALKNTIFYTIVTVPGQMVLGLAIALLLDGPLRARAFFRTLYYIPVVTSWVVVSLIFTYLFNGQAGLINWVLRDGIGVIDKNINWLGEPFTAKLTIAIL